MSLCVEGWDPSTATYSFSGVAVRFARDMGAVFHDMLPKLLEEPDRWCPVTA